MQNYIFKRLGRSRWRMTRIQALRIHNHCPIFVVTARARVYAIVLMDRVGFYEGFRRPF